MALTLLNTDTKKLVKVMNSRSSNFAFMLYMSIVIVTALALTGCAFDGPGGDIGPHLDEYSEPISAELDDEIGVNEHRLLIETTLLDRMMIDYSDEGEDEDGEDEDEDDEVDEDCDDDECDDDVDEPWCEVAEHCEAAREASFCAETLETITCSEGSECFCPSGSWCHLQCPDGGCTFRWGEGSCATLDCPSCNCNAVPPPPGGEPSVATTCFWTSAP